MTTSLHLHRATGLEVRPGLARRIIGGFYLSLGDWPWLTGGGTR